MNSIEVFIKRPTGPSAAQCEAAGLAWLGESGGPVAEVVDVAEGYLATKRVQPCDPTGEAAFEAGRELARIHAQGAPAYGSPPAGWEGPNYIGTQTQPCEPTADWWEFYATQRVEVFLERAVAVGNLLPDDAARLSQLLSRLGEKQAAEQTFTSGFSHQPSRIHGDLWAGNLLFTTQGAVFIDPAAHGGHPLTDLAMLDLFGCPFQEAVFAGYEAQSGLPGGWRAHLPVHQLHPLAVHAVTHGPGYARELVACARRVERTFLG